MQELVGRCETCSKPVYCQDGFLNGVVLEDQTLLCFECMGREQEDAELV